MRITWELSCSKHTKPDNSKKTLQDVVAEARAKLIADSSKGIDEEVHWTGLRHSQIKLQREPGTCFLCGDRRGIHPWKVFPANGRTYTTCGGNDHFAWVCLEDRNFTVPDTRPQASSTRYSRKQQTRSTSGQRRHPRQVLVLPDSCIGCKPALLSGVTAKD